MLEETRALRSGWSKRLTQGVKGGETGEAESPTQGLVGPEPEGRWFPDCVPRNTSPPSGCDGCSEQRGSMAK